MSSSLPESDNEDIPNLGTTKRLKIDNNAPASIISLCTKKSANTFHGDVLTVYGPACAKNINSPVKAQLVHADLTDQYGQMTISVTMANNLIERFATFFSRGASVSISSFVVKQKTIYERGDADVCIHLTANSTVESVPTVCHVRRLAPNTTLNGLRSSGSNYVVGSIAAAVAHCHQTNNQYHFTIKDGENTTDAANLQLNENYKDLFIQVQRQIASGTTPLYLFKNIVRAGPQGSHVLRAGMSTFCEPLNHQHAVTRLKALTHSTSEVQGTLQAKNVYSPPFEPVCAICNNPIFASALPPDARCYCSACGKETEFLFNHSISCVLEKKNSNIECIVRRPLLDELLPKLIEISYEDYQKDISSALDLLQRFQKKGSFVMTLDNVLTAIKEID